MIEDYLYVKLKKLEESGGGGGTTDYADIENKPSINGVSLVGNKSLSDLGIENVSSTVTVQNETLNLPFSLG